MSGDTTMMLMQFLPTILALIIIVFSLLGGFIRGFRKSFILLIHYIISIVAGFVIYFNASTIMLSDGLGNILSTISPEFSGANSLYDLVKILLESYLPDYAAMAANPYIEQVIMVFVGLGVSLALGIVCLVLIPLVIRFVLYLLYLLFYREGKIKSHKLAEGDDYNPHRFLGMFVGVARGVVSAALSITLVTSTFFVLSGGIVEADEQPKENVLILENLSDSIGFDLNALYKGLKASRTTGVGKIFDAILIDGKPVDLYYSDLFMSANINEVKEEENKPVGTNTFISTDEANKAEVAKLYIREELALVFKLLENVLETNAITIENGEVKLDYTLLKESLDEYVEDYVNGSVLISDVVPLAIIGVAESINEGSIVVDKTISDLFTDEIIAEIKELDFSKDLAKIITTAIHAVDLIPVNSETNSFDFAAFSDMNTYLKFDTEKVKSIFNELSDVELLTKVVFPAGVGIALNSYGEAIEGAGIKTSELDLDDINWQLEIKNIGEIYEKVVALDLDVVKLMDGTVNESTGLGNNLQYIIDLCNDEEIVGGKEKSEIFKTNLVNLIDSIFASDLFSQVGLVFVKSKIAEIEILYEDGTSTPLNDALNLVKHNLNYYKEEHLREDLHQIASSCLGVTSLIPLFLGGGEIDLFKILYSIDTDDISSSLLGEYELDENDNRVYTSGIYSLKLLNGSFHADAKYATDSLVEGALLTYATDVISPGKIESITTVDGVKLDPEKPNYDFTAWPNELGALVDAISELQTVEHLDEINTKADNIADILPPEIGAAEIDVITRAASNSILLSGIVEEKLVTFIKNEPTIGYAAQDPDIVWMDTILVDEFGNENVDKGELNSLLKAFVIYSDDKKAMDFNDHDSLINGLAQLLYPMENSSEELDYSDVISFASSQVLMTIVSKEIPSINTGGSGVSIVVPYSLNTTKEGNDDAWKNWAYDETFDYKNGEFARLVEVLYHAREYKRTVATFQDETQEIILRQDNLVHSIIYMEKDDLVTKSKVLHASLSQGIIDKRNDVHSIIKVRENAIENNPNLNPESISNYDVISAIEVDRALDVIRYMELDFNGNDLSDVNIASFLKAINGSKSAEARESICKSNIFNISTVNKITEGSEEIENKGIDVPYLYKHYVDSILSVNLEDSKWYPEAFDANDNTWEECELNKMLLSIVALDIEADETNTQLSIPTSKELFDTIYNDESKLDVIYDSDVFKYTISCKIINQGEIVVRDIAYEEYDPADPNIKLEVIKQDEIKKVVTFLHDAEIDIDNKELDAQHIFSKLKDPVIGASLREQICKSNILNATTVDKIGGNDGPVPETYSLVFPKAYLNLDGSVNKDASLWYPQSFADDDTTWIDCELNKLLISVVELDIVASGNTINLSINEKIDMLLYDSVVEPLDNEGNKNTKLDVVYHSDIIADTISRRLTDTDVEIPYIDSNKKSIFDNIEGRRELIDHIIHEDEVETLLKAVFNLGFTFNSTKKFDYEHIFDDISLSDLSSNINNSEVSILNSSILHLLVSSELIKQKLSIGGAQHSIVTRNYMKDSSLSVTVVETFSDTVFTTEKKYEYIKKDEIKIAINSLSLAGITKVDDAGTINSDKLRELFVTNKDSDNSKQLIENISQSAILSKIFGQILISDKYTIGTEEYSYYQAVGYVAHGQLDYYKLTSASEINGDSVAILSQEDVRSIISNFYKLS